MHFRQSKGKGANLSCGGWGVTWGHVTSVCVIIGDAEFHPLVKVAFGPHHVEVPSPLWNYQVTSGMTL